MIPVLSGNIQELPASRAIRNLGIYYDQQLSLDTPPGVLAEHFYSNLKDVNMHIDSLRGHGFGLAQQYNEQVKTVAVTVMSTEVIFCDETSQVAYTGRTSPLTENLALVNFHIGPIVLDAQGDYTPRSESHFWYKFRRLGEVSTSHFMNVTSTVLVSPEVFERLN